MGRKLPTFSSLRAFEAFARHGTLADAAEELCISSSAVSHQIKALETYLGTKLFIRRANGLEITPGGCAYLAGITGALEQIEAETVQFINHSNTRPLVINIYQTLAQFWLTPILPEFLEKHPDISVRLVTSPDEIDLTGTEIDIAVRHSAEKPQTFLATKLFEEFTHPVASPDYLARHPEIAAADDLAGHSLIECTWFEAEWEHWLDAMGAAKVVLDHHFICDTRSQALAAAVQGLGVALDRYPNGQAMIRQGSLVPVGNLALPTYSAYYLIGPERSAALPQVKSFCKWLKEKTASMRITANDERKPSHDTTSKGGSSRELPQLRFGAVSSTT